MAYRPIGAGINKTVDGRKKKLIMELIYIVLTVAITVMATIVFFLQEKVSYLYSVIFLFAAVINGLTGYRYMQRDHNNKRHTIAAAIVFSVAAVLVGMAIIGIVVML